MMPAEIPELNSGAFHRLALSQDSLNPARFILPEGAPDIGQLVILIHDGHSIHEGPLFYSHDPRGVTFGQQYQLAIGVGPLWTGPNSGPNLVTLGYFE